MLLVWLLAAIAGGVYGWAAPDQPTRLTFLSVGQGDCAVFQTGGTTILIDAGPKTESYDAGKRLVVPDLDRLGVRSVDLILLSHPDEDHVGGAGSILKAYPSATLGMSEQFKEHPDMKRRLEEWRVPPSRILWLRESERLNVESFRLTTRNPKRTVDTSDNEGSMFVHIQNSKASAVLSGDAGAVTEQAMEPLEDWSSQVMKAGHHGSRSSTANDWLEEVKPQYVVISCGRNNVYGHPSVSTLRKLAQRHIATLRTDQAGDVTFDYDPDKGFVLRR